MINNKIIYHMKAKNIKIDVKSITTKYGTAKVTNCGVSTIVRRIRKAMGVV